jgi:hypothetical protein
MGVRDRIGAGLLLAALAGGFWVGPTSYGQDLWEDAAEVLTEQEDGFTEAGQGEIETDRDSFTPSTSVVGRRRVLAETSYSFIDNRSGSETHSFPELLTRIGATERIEFRLGWNYELGGGGSVSSSGSPVEEEPFSEEAGGEANLLYGFKAALTAQDRWLPRSALIVQANTPTMGNETATQFTTGYICGWQLQNGWVVDTGLRYGAASELADHFDVWAPSVVLKIPVHERWNTHIEYFGIFTDQREIERGSQYVSPGLHYLITPDLEVGVRVGWGLTNDSAEFFSNVGAGIRF